MKTVIDREGLPVVIERDPPRSRVTTVQGRKTLLRAPGMVFALARIKRRGPFFVPFVFFSAVYVDLDPSSSDPDLGYVMSQHANGASVCFGGEAVKMLGDGALSLSEAFWFSDFKYGTPRFEKIASGVRLSDLPRFAKDARDAYDQIGALNGHTYDSVGPGYVHSRDGQGPTKEGV